LTNTVNEVFLEGLSAGTRAHYNANLLKFYKFAVDNGLWSVGRITLPSEIDLIFFVAKLVQDGLTPGTIKGTLCGVTSSLVGLGLGNPCKDALGQPLPLLYRMVRGVSRKFGAPRRTRKALTADKLERIFPFILAAVGNNPFNEKCYKFALSLGFYGFLRVGEFVSPSVDATSHDPDKNLNEDDISNFKPGFIGAHVKVSKADPFRNGADLQLAANHTATCPLATHSAYVRIRGSRGPKAPFFRLADGSTLTRGRLQKVLRKAMELAGYNPSEYGTHSLRIGACTSLAAAGWGAEMIQVMGRYASDAFMSYLKVSDTMLREASVSMAAITTQNVADFTRRTTVPGQGAA
jgi:integrase